MVETRVDCTADASMRTRACDDAALWNSLYDVTTMHYQMTHTFKTGILLTQLLLVGGFYTHSAAADGDAGRGETLGYTCLGCHGIEGYRNAYPSYRVPKLGGQKASYLIIALQGYRDGTRQHPTMTAQASSLSDQDFADAAAYLAGLGDATVTAGGSYGNSFEPAQSCAACHGHNGISLSPSWPTLAGQHEDYLVHALNQYRDGSRNDPVMAPMATTLSDETVQQLAKYFASLEGLETTKVE